MKENLYSDIIENDKIVSKYKIELPKNLQNLKYTTISNNSNLRKLFNNEIRTDCDETIKTTKSFNEKKFIIHIDSVNKVIETSMLKSSYIVYRVRFTRLSDLESRACWKRYRDIHTWYQELQVDIKTDMCPFPEYSEGWLTSSNQKDPHSEFVLKRKFDLETFLRELFETYPSLLKQNKVIEFFELDNLPPETMNVIANRVAAREATIVYTQNENTNNAIDYTFNKQILLDICKGDIKYQTNIGEMSNHPHNHNHTIENTNQISVVHLINFDLEKFEKQYKKIHI